MDHLLHKENKNATIGFVIFYPYQFHVYKNVYFELRQESEFIIDLYSITDKDEQEDRIKSITEILDRHDASYRIVCHDEYRYEGYMKAFFSKYECLCSVWEKTCLSMPCTDGIKKVRFPYGVGKELSMLRPSGSIYDLTLAIGERDSKKFSNFSYTEIVGYSRFDDWFKGALNQEEIEAIRAKLDPHKKTIAYLPTHSDLSSVDQLADELKRCASGYNIIAKIHYAMIHEVERIKKLTDPNIILMDDTVDLLSLLAVSDMVISDNSSAIFDAVITDKPLLVADFWDTNYVDETHKGTDQSGRLTRGAITFSDSIEQIIKRQNLVPTLAQPSQLLEKIEETLHDMEPFKSNRKKLCEELFAFNDGACTQRYVDAIRRLMASDTPYPKGAMYHALQVYLRLRREIDHGYETELQRKVESLTKALEQKNGEALTFDCIFFDVVDIGEEQKKLALESFLSQDTSFENSIVHIITTNPTVINGLIDDFTKRTNIGIVFSIHAKEPGQRLGAIIYRILKHSTAQVVIFGDSHTAYPQDWFRSLRTAYLSHATMGVGGYRVPKHRTHFDFYNMLQVSKKLFPSRWKIALSDFFEVTNSAYDQNPAGILSAASYRREAVSVPGYVDDADLLAAVIKKSAMALGPITFMPSHCFSLDTYTAKRFILSTFREGVYEKILNKNDTDYVDSRHSFVHAIFDSVTFFLETYSVKRSLIVLLGNMAFAFGFKRGVVLTWYAKAMTLLTDTRKSLEAA